MPTWKEDLLKPVLILVALRIYGAKVILIDLPFKLNVKLYLLKEKKTKYALIPAMGEIDRCPQKRVESGRFRSSNRVGKS